MLPFVDPSVVGILHVNTLLPFVDPSVVGILHVIALLPFVDPSPGYDPTPSDADLSGLWNEMYK